ncbi:hypothetical protein [Anaplasma phagocytophilum]|uniref:Uncharacterized protein n=2 Tax=Anaplasma phagocytophilum TaxID=948 RepID=Q2GIM5_ANAPZ|nr:hypothetical protein [Anaplasma phagocytophilum]ABD43507.1 hypothetical protein APH_1254 [Anaplasma phagocytophilum str. HZ]AGR79709.1 hypothetical protein YYU_05795 [Anaplasma phagocytophilum str. HZ2]KJV68299.1 hypothetical protein EPHNCH_0016 [Anaplasma phagocytophilum str. NCH-1]KJV87201.1 hypothetical protein APHNYW_1319 [Anaplasma phagocytophilum str. ApNYW]
MSDVYGVACITGSSCLSVSGDVIRGASMKLWNISLQYDLD